MIIVNKFRKFNFCLFSNNKYNLCNYTYYKKIVKKPEMIKSQKRLIPEKIKYGSYYYHWG